MGLSIMRPEPLPLMRNGVRRVEGKSITTQRQRCCLQLALYIIWDVSSAFTGVYFNGS